MDATAKIDVIYASPGQADVVHKSGFLTPLPEKPDVMESRDREGTQPAFSG